MRHPDTQTVEVSVLLSLRRLEWESSHDERTIAVVHLGAAAMTSHQEIVASRFERIAVQSPTDNIGRRDAYATRIRITLRAPKAVDHVRIVLQAGDNKFASLDISRTALLTAAQAPTPEPVLISRPAHATPAK